MKPDASNNRFLCPINMPPACIWSYAPESLFKEGWNEDKRWGKEKRKRGNGNVGRSAKMIGERT
jgi:hypothetical protein